MTEKRVLAVIHAPRWGGIHTIMERVGPVCGELGYPWTVVLPETDGDNGAERLRAAGLDVKTIPLRRIRKTANPLTQLEFFATIPLDIWRLKRLIEEGGYDIVQPCGLMHFHSAVAGRLAGAPVVWQIHSDQPPALLKRVFTPMVVSMSSAVMTSGTRLVDSHPGLSRAASKLVTFLAPVNLDRFRPDPVQREEVRREFGVSPDDIVVGTVGGRGPNKNHGLLIKALRIARETDPRLKARICGGTVEHHAAWYQKNVIDLAKSMDFDEDTVAFVDPGREVARYMNGFDVFCLPSKGEGASIVVGEAMATGLPVIANDVGSLSDTVIDGETGFLNKTTSAEELASLMLKLAGDATLRKAMGVRNQDFAKNVLSVEACAERHVLAYELALGKAHSILEY